MNHIGRIAITTLHLLEARIELAAVELREEQQRFLRASMLAALSGALVLLAVFTAAVALVMSLPVESRLMGWWIAAGIFALAGAALWSLLLLRLRFRPLPFAQTRAELQKDRQCL